VTAHVLHFSLESRWLLFYKQVSSLRGQRFGVAFRHALITMMHERNFAFFGTSFFWTFFSFRLRLAYAWLGTAVSSTSPNSRAFSFLFMSDKLQSSNSKFQVSSIFKLSRGVSLGSSVDRVPTATSASRARTSACNTRRIEAADPKPRQSRDEDGPDTERRTDCVTAWVRASSSAWLSQSWCGPACAWADLWGAGSAVAA
jgi:hypothetical protein